MQKIKFLFDIKQYSVIGILFAFLFVACAKKPSYNNNTYSNQSGNQTVSSIPAIQYNNSYQNGCNTAIFTNSYGTYNGRFCYGKRNGSGAQIYSDPPSRYDGVFSDDKRHGYGTYTWFSSGNFYSGPFINGEQDGIGRYTWSSNGAYMIGKYVVGRQDGEHKTYSRDGIFLSSRFFRNGSLINEVYASQANSATTSSLPVQKTYADPNIKTQKCKRLGLVEGTDDFNLCINSLKN